MRAPLVAWERDYRPRRSGIIYRVGAGSEVLSRRGLRPWARGLIAIEVKAAAVPTAQDARHLRWLKGELGDQVAAAVVFHTGARAYPLRDGVLAVPIAALWTAVL